MAGPSKIDKFFKDPFKFRDDVRRRLRALSCEKTSNIADPQKPAISQVLASFSAAILDFNAQASAFQPRLAFYGKKVCKHVFFQI